MARKITARPNAKANTLDWSSGSVGIGKVINASNNVFTLGAQSITVDVTGDSASLRINEKGLTVNFGDGDFLLQTARPRDTLVLTFDPPVKAAAVQFAAFGVNNPTRFIGAVQARLGDGSDTAIFTKNGETTGDRDGSAICLGIATAANEAPIAAMSCSVEADGPVNAIKRFAINQPTYGERAAVAAATKRAGGI